MPQTLKFLETPHKVQNIICSLLSEKVAEKFFHDYRDGDGITINCTFNGHEVDFVRLVQDMDECYEKDVLLKAKELLAQRMKDKLWAIEDNLQKLVDETIPEIKDDVW